ncbi:MAG: amino acid racemase [Saprospiraceae bacterium]|nr:amino acid racemase [Saprospiraceae bacterium]
MIGIVGGIGPMAGIDLYKKIVDNTIAQRDQEHLSVLLASLPADIADRTAFLLGEAAINPANALARVILLLEKAGARHIGIACNTAHAPAIFDTMLDHLKQAGSQAEICHLIEITLAAIQTAPLQIRQVGVLCTSGSYQARLYQGALERAGLLPVMLNFDRHVELVQAAIYHPVVGLKAAPEGRPEAIFNLNTAIVELQALGAESVVLGCTEIGMVEEALDFQGMTAFNPNLILARTLIQKACPAKLKPI